MVGAVSLVSVQWPAGVWNCCWSNNKRWRLTVNCCEVRWIMQETRWGAGEIICVSYHSLLVSHFITCCRFALIVLSLIESVNLPFNISCDQSHNIHPDLTSCLLKSSLGLTSLTKQQILPLFHLNCNQMSENIQMSVALLAKTAPESRSVFFDRSSFRKNKTGNLKV